MVLSEKSIEYIKLVLKIGAKIHAHPLVWHEGTRSVRVTEVPLWKWKMITVMMGVYMTYSMARFFEAFIVDGKPLHKCIIIIYYSITHIYFNSIMQNLHFRREEVATFVTKFMRFDKSSASEELNGTREDKVGILFQYFLILGYGHACFQGIGFLYFSSSKNFVYAVFSDLPGFNTLTVKLVFAIFEIFYATQAWTVSLLTTFSLFATLENVAIWNNHVITTKSWVGAKKRYKRYKCLQLIVDGFNEAMGPIVLPMGQISVLFEATICLYATIRFYGILPPIVYMMMPTSCVIMVIYTSVIYRFSGQIFKSSDNVLLAWKNCIIGECEQLRMIGLQEELQIKRRVLKLEQMYLRAAPSLGIKVDRFYFIKPGTTMTYCSIIVNNTINLLLA